MAISSRTVTVCTALMLARVGWGEAARAHADEAACVPITRAKLVSCALSASLPAEHERLGVALEEGKRRALTPLLPSNPSLSLSGAHRQTVAGRPSDRATNWYGTLAQEVELAGQRGARRQSAALAKSAQEHALVATERAVAAEAWRAWFEALAARDALETALGLERTFAQIGAATEAGAESGLTSGVDADVAALTLVRLSQLRIEAERRAALASATLASLLGLDPARAALAIEGALEPLERAHGLMSVSADEAVARRPELAQAADLQRSHEYAGSALRRGRVPNLTFSLYAQRDGFDERVLGGGVSLPIPLPYPLGRTLSGELVVNDTRTRQAATDREHVSRAARLSLVAAQRSYEAALAALALYPEPRVQSARRSLDSIAKELAAGRLAIGGVVIAQQTLMEFLRAHVEAKLTVCLSSVELVLAAGLPLAGGAP